MSDVTIELVDFSDGADAAGFHAELAAAGLLPLAVSVSGSVLVAFAAAPSGAQLATIAAVVAAHDAPAAALAIARESLKASTAERLADLQDFREAATKTAEQLDTEAAAVDAQIDAAPDEATARLIAEAYTRQKL